MKKAKCETCVYKGYSAEICRFHSLKTGSCDEQQKSADQHPLKRIGKAVALGAGAGVAAGFAGIAVGPLIGLKAALGHAMAAKIAAGGGVAGAGAGVSVARKMKRGESKAKPAKRKRILLPMYSRG